MAEYPRGYGWQPVSVALLLELFNQPMRSEKQSLLLIPLLFSNLESVFVFFIPNCPLDPIFNPWEQKPSIGKLLQYKDKYLKHGCKAALLLLLVIIIIIIIIKLVIPPLLRRQTSLQEVQFSYPKDKSLKHNQEIFGFSSVHV